MLAAFTGGARADTGSLEVAVLDSGIDASHPEFTPGQVVEWRDFVGRDSAPHDDHGHGTAVASRVAGATLGAFPGARLIVGKVLDAQNRLTSWSPLASAIRWATDRGADVINVSIWGTAPQPTNARTISLAVEYARDHDVLVVWIAGNGGTLSYPSTTLVGSSSPQALIVGAATSSGDPAPFSQRDPELTAHGQDVVVAWPNGSFTTGSGTSYAAPWIAGAALRLLADGAPRDPDWLEWVLLHSARDTAASYYDEGYGFVGVDEFRAARAIARGERPLPSLDARDLFHIGTTIPRTAQNASLPAGITPP